MNALRHGWLLMVMTWISTAAPAAQYLEDLWTGRLVSVETAPRALFAFVQPSCLPCKNQLKAMECLRSKDPLLKLYAVQSVGTSGDLQRSLRGLPLGFPVLKGSQAYLREMGVSDSPTPVSIVVVDGVPKTRIVGPKSCAEWEHELKKWE